MNDYETDTEDLGNSMPVQDKTDTFSYGEDDLSASYTAAETDAGDYDAAEYDGQDDEADFEEPVRAGKYRFFSLLIFVITAGGLFLGLLGKFAGWITPSFFRGVPTFLENSLVGYVGAHIYSLIRNFRGIFSGGFVPILINLFYLGLAAVACIAVIVTLICLIVSLASGKRAKKAAGLAGGIALLAYTLLSAGAYCYNSLHAETLNLACIDVPVTMITGLLLFIMIVYSIAENRIKGLCGVGAYLFTAAAVFALFYPSSFTERYLVTLTAFKENLFYNISFLAAFGLILLDLAVSSLALARDGKGVVRCVLSALQLIAVVLLTVAGSLLGGKWSWEFFTGGALLPSLILLVSTLGGFLLAILVRVIDSRERAAEEEEADTDVKAEVPEEVPEETEEEETLSYPVEETPEESVEETAQEAAESVPPVEEAVEETVEETVEEPVEEPVEGPAEEAEESEAAEPAPMSDFEREMLSLAEGKSEEAPKPAEPLVSPAYAPAYPQAAPAYRPVPVYTDFGTQYTYDPFINELTPEEKNEFGDLFIACKTGKFSDLPVYHIGGDNTEFFDKVWIRYGMYDMSPNLKEKIFSYLRRYKFNK